jgi:aminoglycoside phosphotransferase
MLVNRGDHGHEFVDVDGTRPVLIEQEAERVLPHVVQPLWRLLAEPGTRQIDLTGSTAERRRLRQQIRTLPPGTGLVLCCSAVGSRQRFRRFAKDAGIEMLREYVAIPSALAPTCYVEDTPQALRYFFSELLALPRGGAIKSALLGAAKTAARLPVPWSALGAVAPVRVAVGRIPYKPTGIIELVNEAGLLGVAGMETVVVALSKDPNAKVTLLLIPHGSEQPTVAVKIPTTKGAEATIAAERRLLTDLRARLPAAMLSTIPTIVHLAEAQGRVALVTTALPGSPMRNRYHAWQHLASADAVRDDFMAVERWLARFQSATAGPPAPVDMDNGGVAILRRRFAGDPALDGTLATFGAIHARLRTSKTPRTAVHGDFWFGNLLVSGEEISGVVDWEAGSKRGEPVRDIVRFALTYALYLDRHSRSGRRVAGHRGLRAGVWGSGIDFAINGEGWFPDLFREFVRGGLSRLGADPDRWHDATLAGIAEVAATADHGDFAALHWQLFKSLTELPTRTGGG